ncbi:uncharacterized protein LOC127798049 [Diospyros lotus]|uniref:uncharacterized protein LOC127798049 n=1 Tax=Diospyros lotus TaxID=55363 RepID=UPI0022557F79|nr:uncharacterized protein LOC127798049 [Diospyros lotus]
MKDLSFFLLKNCVAAKMRKGYRGFCNDDGSTSILNQRKAAGSDSSRVAQYDLNRSSYLDNATSAQAPPTLQEMILQLEFEERIARRAKLDDQYGAAPRRMSCVNNSDILRSARNALNQYPRFSLDGKDAMYQSSFRNMPPVSGRRSICCNHGFGCRKSGCNSELEKSACLPPILAGESVVWCKPGVVAKLMGLEAMPVPVHGNRRTEKLSSANIVRRQNLRKRAEKHETERRKAAAMDINGRGRVKGSACSATKYCTMKPTTVEPARNDGTGWPVRRFL